ERQKRGKNVVNILQGQDVDQDTDGEDEWDGFDDDNGGAPVNKDVDMDEAPQLVEAKKNPEPEIDEDGFTRVVGKKKR
ncbi:rRNA accumulation-related protein, partial [Elasticomyces elasticus]